jgi:hypothetical protein
MLIPHTIASTYGPAGTERCRPVHIRASGEAAALGVTEGAAHREAKAEARRQLARAVARVRTIRCPKKGGCAAGCRQGRTQRLAWGTRRAPAIRRAHMWEVWVREYNVFRMNCHCPD